MILFSEKDIKDECGYQTLNRGKSYFQQGRVIRFNSGGNQNKLEISGLVAGTKKYQQNIYIYQNPLTNIEGDCSCPVGYNCKHVAAVLINYLDATNRINKKTPAQTRPKQNQQELAIERWFNEFDNMVEPIEKAPQVSKYLAYILSDSKQSGEIEISFAKTGAKKNGGYYKPMFVNFDSLASSLNYRMPDYFTQLDQIIVTLLNTQRDRYFYSYKPILLEGEIGQQILEKMLISQRCFWSELGETNLLSDGDSLDLNFQWHSLDLLKDSTKQLQLNLNSAIRLVAVKPPFYINTQSMQVGPLNTPLSAEQVKLFSQMPPVPKKLLESVSLKLLSENLDKTIPLPVAIEISYLDGKDLIPKVELSHLKLDGKNATHCLNMSFLYGEHEIQIMDEANILINNAQQYLKINRDLAKELAYFKQLEDLGFEMVQHDKNRVALISPANQNQQTQLQLWKNLIEDHLPKLIADGWIVSRADQFDLNFIEADEDWDVEVENDNDWFSLKFDLNLSDGQKLPLLPLVTPLLKDYNLDNIPDELLVETQAGQYITLNKSKVLPILKLLYELFDAPPSSDRIKISTFDALQINQLADNQDIQLNWLGSKRLKQLGEKLANFAGLKTVNPSKKFNGELREYQQQGLNWLQFLRDFEFAGLLADDMGLGKTIQTLVHLQKEKMAKRMLLPCLIVAPTSLMSNWKREAQLFTPDLKVLILQGADRHQKFEKITDYDLVLTTYPLIVRDNDILSNNQFYTIVLDEAQNIKNPKSKATQLLKSLSTKHRIALTGTPMENHLGELWSIFDFLMPGFLGSETAFKKKYRTPIEKHANSELAKMLAQRVKPFLLRRTKELVAKELPPKTTIIKSAVMGNHQATLYETIRIAMEKKIEQALATKGLNRSHITILDALLKLRQVCCDPQLLKLAQAKKIKDSAKLELLMTMLPELLEEGRRILLFSQFTSMLKLIEEQLKLKKITYTKLTGSTKNREQVIDQFTSGQVSLFLISLKAGGVGLNLTEADTVIHYDPWWNPAVENQASDRAHRIGQDKPVFVYKLIVENTLEEKILEMQVRKQALADGVYGDNQGKKQSALTKEDIAELLASRV